MGERGGREGCGKENSKRKRKEGKEIELWSKFQKKSIKFNSNHISNYILMPHMLCSGDWYCCQHWTPPLLLVE